MTDRLEKVSESEFKRIKTIEEVVHIRELRQEKQNLLLQIDEMKLAQESLKAALEAKQQLLIEVKAEIKSVLDLGVKDEEETNDES